MEKNNNKCYNNSGGYGVVMKTILDMDVENKSVVVRCDFNVPIEDGVITDSSRVKKSLKTIKYLLDKNCKVVLLSHFGRVKKEEDKKNNTLKPVASLLAELLKRKVVFLDECYGQRVKDVVANASLGDVIRLENTRFMDVPDMLESNNDDRLAEYFASLGDVFINDAFGALHRNHASTAGIAKYIDSGIGFLVKEELDKLYILVDNTPAPFAVFMGGAKVDDKLPIIKKFIDKCDYLMLGGGIANSFFKATGRNVGESVATSDANILKDLKELYAKYEGKIILPSDFTLDDGRIILPGDFTHDDGKIYDVGPISISKYKEIIDNCATVFVNGTPGLYEDDRFRKGTIGLLSVLASSPANVIIGGGDTASAVKKFGFDNAFSHVSSGGGATLEFIANGGTLPVLDALEESNSLKRMNI